MIVVSDTSPLNYLVLIDCVHILPQIFDEVWIPPAVFAELGRPEAPSPVRSWLGEPHDWLAIESPKTLLAALDLDAGEREAISLAVEVGASFVLLDDKKGRTAAQGLGLTVVGTLAVLEAAALRGLIPLRESIARLQQTNFRIAPYLVQEAIRRVENGGS